MSKEELRFIVDMMEKDILYFKGKKRENAKRRYNKLLRSCGNDCGLEESIYLKRSE